MNIPGNNQSVSNAGVSSEVNTSKSEESEASKGLLGKRVRKERVDPKKQISSSKHMKASETTSFVRETVNVVEEVFVDTFDDYTQEQKDAFRFVEVAASQDADHSIDEFDKYFSLSTDRFPHYGAGLVFLYGALHRHGQDDDVFAMERFYPSILSSGIADDAKTKAKALLQDIKATRLESASVMDQAIRNHLGNNTEQVIEGFRQSHYYNGELDIADDD